MKLVAIFIALTLGSAFVHARSAANNNFECFAPEQDAGVALFTRDLRVFKLVRNAETTLLKLDRKAIRHEPTRLAFEGDSIRLELTFENDNRANGVLTGLEGADAPVHWLCARQLYGP